MSLFQKILQGGAAYLQHVAFAKAALAASDDQRSNVITEYVQGLTGASFAGLKGTLVMLSNQENDGRAKQAIQLLLQDIDAARTGKLQAAKPPELTIYNTYDADLELVGHWLDDPTQDEWKTALINHLIKLDSAGYYRLTQNLQQMKAAVLKAIQQHKANEPNAWGPNFEDRMAYFFARERTGARDPEFIRVLRLYEQTLDKLELVIESSNDFWPLIQEHRGTAK